MSILVYGFGLPVGVRVVRKCAIPKEVRHITLPAKEPESFGEHLRYTRAKRGLSQRQAAPMLGISLDALKDWEMDRALPLARQFPRVVEFIGYDPLPAPQTIGEAWKRKRFWLGLTAEEMCQHLGVSRRMWRERERDQTPCCSRQGPSAGQSQKRVPQRIAAPV